MPYRIAGRRARPRASKGTRSGPSALTAIAARDYLLEYPSAQVVTPNASSWGDGGYYRVWINGPNEWLYPHLNAAARRFFGDELRLGESIVPRLPERLRQVEALDDAAAQFTLLDNPHRGACSHGELSDCHADRSGADHQRRAAIQLAEHPPGEVHRGRGDRGGAGADPALVARPLAGMEGRPPRKGLKAL